MDIQQAIEIVLNSAREAATTQKFEEEFEKEKQTLKACEIVEEFFDNLD